MTSVILVLSLFTSRAWSQAGDQALVESAYQSLQKATEALHPGIRLLPEHPLLRSPEGCARSWPSTSFWEMRGGSGGSPPTLAVVRGEVFPLSGFAAPEIVAFVNALVSSALKSVARETTRCLVETLAFSLSATGEPFIDGLTDSMPAPTKQLALALRQRVSQPWPLEGLKRSNGLDVAVITIFQLEPIQWVFQPVSFAFVFDTSHRLIGWSTRTGQFIAPPDSLQLE